MSLRVDRNKSERSSSRTRDRSASRTHVRISSQSLASSPTLDHDAVPRYRHVAPPAEAAPANDSEVLNALEYEMKPPLAGTSGFASLSREEDNKSYFERLPSTERPKHVRISSSEARNPPEAIAHMPITEEINSAMPPSGYPEDPSYYMPRSSQQDRRVGMASPTIPYPLEDSHMPQSPDGYSESYGILRPHEYATPAPYQYAAPPSNIKYTTNPVYPKGSSEDARNALHRSPTLETVQLSRSYATQVREVKHRESRENKVSSPPLPQARVHSQSLTVSDGKQKDRAPSLGRLSVSGTRPDLQGLSARQLPASPLLEAYRGTYQSTSPMPSPMILPTDDIDDLPPLSPVTTIERQVRNSSISEPKQKKKVKIYDAEADAQALGAALNHHEARRDPLIDILPELSHDQLLELRDAYKKCVKVQGRGVNLTKHVKLKTTGNFGKICYVTSLGRWESESYWANFWYQAHSSNRELLIEALMGKSNAEIREIKDSFRDKRYHDNLSKCMERELKPDKFRNAVLMALEGRRQEETEAYPVEYRSKDAEMLNHALKSRDGGETAIIQIVVSRSDVHLREVLRTYERMYQANFAREALKKSNNLVGELVAHILNGAINKPARDALLVRHAIHDIAKHSGELRYELLISRLVRLHWDRLNLVRVKEEYWNNYHSDLKKDIQEATKGDFREFCLRLCETL